MPPILLTIEQSTRSDMAGDGLIQVVANAEKAAAAEQVHPASLPVLPIRNSVLFPGAIVPLTIGRESSRRLLDSLPAENGWVAVFTQKTTEKEEAGAEDLHPTGVAAQVLRVVKTDDSVVAIVSARERIRLRQTIATEVHGVFHAGVADHALVDPAVSGGQHGGVVSVAIDDQLVLGFQRSKAVATAAAATCPAQRFGVAAVDQVHAGHVEHVLRHQLERVVATASQVNAFYRL